MNLKLKQAKDKSQLNFNLSSTRQQNPKKIISSKKNQISKKSSKENSKTLTYSNSKNDLKNSINKSDSSFINGNKFMNVDNIDESSYNKEPFIIPKKTNKKYYTSNIEKAVDTYNEIKKEINMKLYNNKVLNNTKAVQIRNYSMVTLLEKLNKVLDTIVERSRVNKNKVKINPLIQSQEIIKKKEKENDKRKLLEKNINNNLLNSYIQQNNILSAKYDKLTNGNYAINLKTNIADSTQAIAKLEKENRELKSTQSRNEQILKNLKTTKDEFNYKKKFEEYDKLNIEFESINRNIKLKENESKVNEKRIIKLEENNDKLIKTAKDKYNIETPEETLEEKKKDSKDIEKMKLYIKRKELENEKLKTNNVVKKYIIMEKDNQKFIKELEENLKQKYFDIKLKKEEIIKLNEILEKIDIENNNFIFQTEIKNINYNQKKEQKNLNNNNINNNFENIKENEIKNIKEKEENLNNKKNNSDSNINININEFNDNLKPKNVIQSQPGIRIKELNNRYSVKKENAPSSNNLQVAKTYNKKMILQQLDDQKKREEDNSSKIKLDKKNLKPNFSFSLNNSSKKEKQDKNINLSVALISNRNKNKDLEIKNETEEINEDINTNIYEEKLRPEEEEQRIITNLSQKISIDKYKKETKEEINNNENIEENMEENLKENINEKEEKKDNNKKNLNEQSEKKIRQNDLNTLPFYGIDDTEKNVKDDNNSDKLNNDSNNNKINNDNDYDNKDGINNKENKKKLNETKEEVEKYEEAFENKEEKEEKENNEDYMDNYLEDENFEENFDDKENKEKKENKKEKKMENDDENYFEDENYDYKDEEINLDDIDDVDN